MFASILQIWHVGNCYYYQLEKNNAHLSAFYEPGSMYLFLPIFMKAKIMVQKIV